MQKLNSFSDIMSSPSKRNSWLAQNRINIIFYLLGVVVIFCIYHFLSDGDFSFLLTLGGIIQLLGFFFLCFKLCGEGSCTGVSLKTLQLYALVYFSRCCSVLVYDGYLPYDSSGDYVYRLVEVLSLFVVCVLIFLTLVVYRDTYNPSEDSFGRFKNIPNQLGVVVLIVPCAIMALILHPSLNSSIITNILWTFALYLETVAVLPQFALLQKANRPVEAWVSHFVFAIGLSRSFLAIFWAISWHELSDSNSIGITGGWVGCFVLLCQLIHVGMTAEFCYYYVKASVDRSPLVLPGLQV